MKHLSIKVSADGTLDEIEVQKSIKADQDGNGDNIAITYAQQTGYYANMQVGFSDRAEADWNGNNISDTYAKQTGSYPDMTVGACGQASEANTAVNDSKGNNISETYATKEQFVGKIASFGVYSPSAPAPILNDPEKAPTCRALYYGLPQINGTTCLGYSANTEIFAPTSEGATGQLITSNGSALSWEWVFNAITDDYANIQESATYIKYFRIPYNATRRLTIVYGRKNSSGSTALFEDITFPTAAKFIVTPIVFTTYYASSNDTGQIENMYGWVRGDKVTKTGFTARSYGGKSFVWLAIGYSET